MAKAIKCTRCGRRARNLTGWNADLKAGDLVGIICPDCQSPLENAEAEINESTLNYLIDPFGRVIGTLKGGGE